MKTLKWLTVLASFGFLLTTATAQSFITNGLVAYYPFNGNANDASGRGHNGTIINATLSTDRFGITNRSYFFNGTNAYISVPQSSELQPVTNFSISVWAKCIAANSSRLNTGPVMVNEHNYDTDDGFDFFVGIDNSIWFQASGGYGGATVSSPLVTNVWFNTVFTWDSTSGLCSLYVNGKLVNSVTHAYSKIVSSYPLQIGAQFGPANDFWFDANGVGSYWFGQLDDIRIYKRVLPTNEVAQLYQLESAPIINIQKAVYLTSDNLLTGSNYVVQASTDLINWTNQGSVFAATNSSWRSTNYWDVANWNELFFRLKLQ